MANLCHDDKPALFLLHLTREQPIMLMFYLLCYAPVLKLLTYYAQYYAHVNDLFKFGCFIRVYSLAS